MTSGTLFVIGLAVVMIVIGAIAVNLEMAEVSSEQRAVDEDENGRP